MSTTVAIPGSALGAGEFKHQGTGKHCWDLLGTLPTSWHYGVVPAGISHP